MKTHQSILEPLESRRMFTGVAQTILVSDGVVPANVVDQHLLNPWGLAIGPTGVLWPSNNASGDSTAYTDAGQTAFPAVTIPVQAGGTGASQPTGAVANTQASFPVSKAGTTGDSLFIFATLGGTIAGWSPSVDSANAITVIDNSTSGALYNGLAIAGQGDLQRLYATNFAKGTVDVFDHNFQRTSVPGGFVDPNLPATYSPFNVQKIEGQLYVTYAVLDPADGSDVPGAGHGIVDVFGKGGVLKERLATGGTLNSPWGVAVAPDWGGPFADKILIGNFGDGHISAFGRKGLFLGQLQAPTGQPLAIGGLWSLTRGNAGSSDAEKLFFTAGPNGETDGELGILSR